MDLRVARSKRSPSNVTLKNGLLVAFAALLVGYDTTLDPTILTHLGFPNGLYVVTGAWGLKFLCVLASYFKMTSH